MIAVEHKKKKVEKARRVLPKRYKISACWLIILGFVAGGWLRISISAETGRGLTIEGAEKITNEQGQEVILYQESYALLIGMSNYINGWPKLPGVQRDVQEVKKVLEARGFKVIVKMDLDRNTLEQTFTNFINQYGLKPENRLLLYFAGHGHTLKPAYGGEMGYIVPTDAPLPGKDETGFLMKAMDMQMIEVYARRIQAKHALFLFDSCFSGSLFAITRAAPEHITEKTANPVRQFITSGSANEQVPDESIFRQQFVTALEGEGDYNGDRYITGSELGIYLEDKVVNYTRGAQHPQYGKIRDQYLDKGDFVFQLPEQPTPTPTQMSSPSPTPPRPPEMTSSFDDLDLQMEWQAYLDKMRQAFSKVQRYDTLDFTADAKIAAWQRFLNEFSADHPSSSQDEDIRNTAQERIQFWKKLAMPSPIPTPLLPTPTSFPTATPRPPKLTPQATPTSFPTRMPQPQPTVSPTPDVQVQLSKILVHDEKGSLITPEQDGRYRVVVNTPVKIVVDLTNPARHAIRVTWKTGQGKLLPLENSLTNTYIAVKEGGDYIVVILVDQHTGQEFKYAIAFDVVNQK